MTDKWQELCMAEELAYFKGDMVLDSPESYTVEEMWEVVMEMFETTIAIQDAMHEDFMSHTPEERQKLLEELCASGIRTPEWWKNTLLGYEEMPDYPAQITGEMEMSE